MFIPLRSDRPLRDTPYVNYALIGICVLAYALTTRQLEEASYYFSSTIESVYNQLYNEALIEKASGSNQLDAFKLNPDEELQVFEQAHIRANELTRKKYPMHALMLHKYDTAVWQFLSYQFLHASPMHLIGNLIFLWVFGNAVEDRLGKVGYLFFYLAMGVFAGLGHWLTSDAPVLGASGSVAGVTGAFLALFPRIRITFLYIFFLIGTVELPATIVVLFYFIKDIAFFSLDIGNVAYSAHLAGNIAGFAVGMLLLGTRLIPRETFDLLSVWQHKRKKSEFKKLTRDGYQPWEGTRHTHGSKGRQQDDQAPDLTEQEKALLKHRQSISRAFAANDPDQAAALYKRLLVEQGEQVLSQRQQFDVANQLFARKEHPAAARAYALLLKTYPTHTQRAHAQLILGLINARYLGKPDEARPLLQEASQRLHGDDAKLARQLLAEIG